LGSSFGGRDSLGVDVERDPAVGVPQQLLHGFYVFAVRLQNCRIRPAECQP
jgi:hypothetical protein